jgi:hypothetical protein
MIFELATEIPEGYREWFTVPVLSSLGAAANVSVLRDIHLVQLGLARIGSRRSDDLLRAADPACDLIYYTVGSPTTDVRGTWVPVTTYFKTKSR